MDNATAATQSGSLPTAVEARSAPVDGHFNVGPVDLSGYKITEPLGAGSGGEVFLFTRPDAEKYALKKCKGTHDDTMEVHVLSMVNHKNVLRLIAVLRPFPDETHLVLELMAGSLKDVFSSVTLPPAQIAVVLKEVLSGVIALHRAKIIQCDIKALNILFDASGRIVIADFGLSTTFDGRTWRGTAPFIAPEIFDALYISRRQRHPVTPSIDEWGAGLVGLDALFSGTLWKMQLGRVEPGRVALALRNRNGRDVVDALCHSAASYRHMLKHLPIDFKDFLNAALAPKPEDRLPADELIKLPFIATNAESERDHWKDTVELVVKRVTAKKLDLLQLSRRVHDAGVALNPPPTPPLKRRRRKDDVAPPARMASGRDPMPLDELRMRVYSRSSSNGSRSTTSCASDHVESRNLDNDRAETLSTVTHVTQVSFSDFSSLSSASSTAELDQVVAHTDREAFMKQLALCMEGRGGDHSGSAQGGVDAHGEDDIDAQGVAADREGVDAQGGTLDAQGEANDGGALDARGGALDAQGVDDRRALDARGGVQNEAEIDDQGLGGDLQTTASEVGTAASVEGEVQRLTDDFPDLTDAFDAVLPRYKRLHNGRKWKGFECLVCSEYIAFFCRIETHMAKHQAEGTFPCGHCDIKPFGLEWNRDRHEAEQHS